ncbi:TniQ family protein [Streptomyces sp. NBC_00859]|uniref:TniQ family protein n=1 Tax=Streptomyces sp. NBC_00859 TaxID=2903682 RepID=UPI003868EB11|nr:TniQ family protein [Streptomyces sp. NBC_00859]WSZ86764.1 TniQ family protein [Streptomyces sp. NBC_00859]
MDVTAHTLVRVPPLSKELTGSWVRRLAHGYRLPAQDLLRSVITGPDGAQITGTPRTGLELFLNAPARAAFLRFSAAPRQLTGRLPEFTRPHERVAEDLLPRAAWYMPRQAWVTACPQCSGRFATPLRPVLVYPQAAGHICPRHQRWLLADADRPKALGLHSLPEVLGAHRQHSALVRTHPQATAVMALAAAVVWSWQIQGWAQEAVWQQRTMRLAALTRCTHPAVAAHALIAYPETVAVARLLADRRWQRRLREVGGAYGCAAATGLLLTELGHRTDRSWLADWLTARSRTTRTPDRGTGPDDPLQRWLARLIHTGDTEPGCEGGLWQVPRPAVRPLGYNDRTSFLIETSARTAAEEAQAASLTGGWEPAPARAGPEAGRCP